MNKKYPSKYSNGVLVSAAQFITEIICERIAKKQKKDLHYRFWLSDTWAKEYKGQIGSANKLLSKYDANDIIDALRSYRGEKIYSLRAPHLPGIIDDVIAQKAKKQKNITTEHISINRNLLESGVVKKKTNNILDKLKELDNGSDTR